MPGRPTAVRPCVALLHSYDDATGLDADAEEAFMLSLDAKEVAAVFTAPFHNFLKTKDEEPDNGTTDGPDNWYEGLLWDWEGRKWNSKLHKISSNFMQKLIRATNGWRVPLP